MRSIRKEAGKHTIISLAATFVSGLATLTIYSAERELYGLLGFVLDTGFLLVPIIIFGGTAALKKYYPQIKSRDGRLVHGGLISLILLTILILSFAIILAFIFLDFDVQDIIPNMIGSGDAEKYIHYTLPAAMILTITAFLFSLSTIYRDVGFSTIVNSFVKFWLPTILILVWFGVIGEKYIVELLLGGLFLSMMSLLIYCIRKGYFRLGSPKEVFKQIDSKSYWVFSLISLVTVFGSQITQRIDGFMVSTMFDFGYNGEYRIASFMAGIVLIPYRSLTVMLGPQVSLAWKNNDMDSLNKMYRTSSIHSLIIGFLLFLSFFAVLDSLLMVMPRGNEMIHLKTIFLVVGSAKLFDLASGVNDEIILYSKRYKISFYLLSVLIISNIALNLWLGRVYGLAGIALATSLSLILFNLAKLVLIRYYFKLVPFSMRTIKLSLVFISLMLIVYSLGTLSNPYFDIILKSVFVFTLYLPLVYYLKISPEWNELLRTKYFNFIS